LGRDANDRATVMRITRHSTRLHSTGARSAVQFHQRLNSALGQSFPSLIFHLLPHLLISLSMLFMPHFCYGQEANQQVRQRRVYAQGEEVSPGDVIRVDTDLVPVEVTVRDGAGQPVRGLRRDDFRIFEDGVERPISFFSAESTGGKARCLLDLIFALDVSGSVTRREMEMLRNATALFKEGLSGQGSRFAVISFGMNVKILQTFTDDQRKLDQAFDSAIRDEMGLSTHAYDAVDEAVRLLVRRGRKTSGELVVKRVVIVITDGFPTGSTVSPRTVIERANAANVTIYSVTMPSFSYSYAAAYGKPLPTIFDLSGLVEETGGTNAYAPDNNYNNAFQSISEEVLSRYVLAFYPGKEKRRDSNFHKLRIEAPDGLKISQSRQGYMGKVLR
jgi:VWFA-related protein